MLLKGTEALVKALKQADTEFIFAYPGGYAIDIFDALYDQDDIEVILPRHEQGLIHAADGYARSSGKVGVCLVTSGPGATNLVTGIATANYDSVPLVCITGQVPSHLIGNDAFQEVDIVGITRGICKYSVTVRKRCDLVRIIKEAFYIAQTGKPGPVLVDIPKDIQNALYEDNFDEPINIRGYKPNTSVHMGQIKRAYDMLKKSKKPLFLAGGGINISGANEEFTALINTLKVPVVTTIMGKGAIPTDNKYYIGNMGMHGAYAANIAISECDLLFSIGTRFNDRITGKINEFAPNAQIVHIDIESASISRNIKVDVPIVADARQAVAAIASLNPTECDTDEWLSFINEENKKYPVKPEYKPGLTPVNIINTINRLYNSPIIVTDVGQHQMWTAQYLDMPMGTKLLTSGGLGTMGYGFPAAIGAKIANPDKEVICISGDGGMQMNIQEMAAAVSLELPITICIFNNSYLGMVRQWQQLFYNKRYSSTCLKCRKSCDKNCLDKDKECPPYTPDFVKLAESYDAKGIRVFEENEIEPALRQAAENKSGPTIIEFIIDTNELVLPMVPGGNALNEMVLDC